MLIPDDTRLFLTQFIKYLLFERVVLKETFEVANLSAVYDYYGKAWLVLLVDRHFGDLSNDLHTIYHLSEYHILAI